jgi:hypothetical protein
MMDAIVFLMFICIYLFALSANSAKTSGGYRAARGLVFSSSAPPPRACNIVSLFAAASAQRTDVGPHRC